MSFELYSNDEIRNTGITITVIFSTLIMCILIFLLIFYCYFKDSFKSFQDDYCIL